MTKWTVVIEVPQRINISVRTGTSQAMTFSAPTPDREALAQAFAFAEQLEMEGKRLKSQLREIAEGAK